MPGTVLTLTENWRRWLPWLTGVCLVGLSLLGWYALERQRQKELGVAASIAGGWMGVAISRDLHTRVAAMENLADQWSTDLAPSVYRTGRDILTQLPGFKTLGWVDESDNVLRLDPDTGEWSTHNRSVTDTPALLQSVMTARNNQHPTMSEPYALDSGKLGLAVLTPAPREQGLLLAELELDDWLDSLLLSDTRRLTHSRLLLQNQLVYEHNNAGNEAEYGPTTANRFDTYNLSWSVQIRSSNWPLSRMNSILSRTVLLLCFLLAAITTWFVTVKLQASEQAGKLLNNTQQLKSLWMSLPGMAFRRVLHDPAERNYLGDGCLALSGYSKAEFEQGTVHWEDLVAADDRVQRLEQMSAADAENPNYLAEYRITCKDKSLKWVWENGRKTFGKLGEELSIDGLIIDVTRRKQTELALVDAEVYSRAIVDTAAEAVITIDEEGVIESFNRAAEAMFGYSRQEAFGMEVTQLMPESYRHTHQNYVNQHIGEAGSIKHISGRELTGKRRDGTIFPIQLSISAFQGRNGRRFVGLLRDLSVQRAAEQEARLHRDRLAHIDRVNILGEMATGIAHEINQPLSAISMYAQSSLRYLDAGNPKPERLREALEKLSQQAHRAGSVIEHMQQFARQRETDREEFNCNELISKVVSLADSEALLRNINIVLDLDTHPCLALGDTIQIEQVILNLLRNGMESMESVKCENGNQIILSTRCDASTVTIAVTDSGAGVSDEATRLLFQPFKSTKQMGMGVGLTICQSIVQAHGGKLGFINNADCGATFEFTLPHFSRDDK